MPSPLQDVAQALARAAINADRVRLVRQVSLLVSDEMLEQIARADYGHDASQHLKTLRLIRKAEGGAKLSWQEREVLELVRWSRPETEPNEEAQRRAHTMRLFACALLVSDGDPLGDAEIQTLAPLFESLLALGERNLIDAAADLLIFRLDQRGAGPEARPFFAFGLLLLLALTGAPELRPQEWELLGAWVIDEESASRSASGLFTGPWLLGSTIFDMRHDVWRRLAGKLLSAPSIQGLELVIVGVSEWDRSVSGSSVEN